MTSEGKQPSTVVVMMFRIFLFLLLVGTCVVLREVANLANESFSPIFAESKSCHCGVYGNAMADLAVDHRRRLAAIIADVQRELHRNAGNEATIDAKWSLKLAEVTAELDPRMSWHEKTSTWDYSARLPDTGPAPQLPNRKRHVCPEVYDNSGDNYWNFMMPENCSYVPEFKTVLTALLPAYRWRPGTASFVVQQIRKFHDVPIIVLISPEDNLHINMTNVHVLKHDEKDSEAETLNNAINMVSTPFVFMGFSLTHFDKESSLKRLVRVLDELEQVKVVGGAARDLHGRWIHGCLQQRMAYYQAYYASGYRYSRYECMYCDDLLSSFVTYKKQLTDIPLTTELSGPALYRDWFAKVREKGQLVMLCPDAMFYVDKHVTLERDDWRMFGKRWALEKIHSFDKTVYSFTCKEVGISCENPLKLIRSFLVPSCCLYFMEKYAASLTEYADKNNLTYELQGGSVLGAVKMGRFLPWDIDMDFSYPCKDYERWQEKDTPLTSQKCFKQIVQPGVYFDIYCPYFFLEFYCREKLSGELILPDEYKNISTTISFAGHDIKVSANPGKHARNKLGFDMLKHAAHWKTLKTSEVALAKGGYDNPGSWNRCMDPSHHSCQDHMPGDGNLPFLEPFLLL